MIQGNMANPWYFSKWGDWKVEKDIMDLAEYYNPI